MKKMFSIIIIIFLIFGLVVPAFAWDFTGNLYDNLAPQEIINERPIYAGSNKNTLTFYNPEEEKYYHAYNFYSAIPDYEFQSSTGLMLNGAFDWSYWDGQSWQLIQSDITNIDISSLLLVHYSDCNINIDGTSFIINSDGYIELGGVVQTPHGGGSSDRVEPEDDYSKGIWETITDFFSTFWDNFFGIFKEWWDYIVLTFNDIFVPNAETLSQSVVKDIDSLVSEVPLIGQVSTIWRVIFNAMPTSTLSLDEDFEKGSFSDVDKLFFDLDTYYRIMSNVNVSDVESSSSAPVTYVFSDPSQDITLHVPTPNFGYLKDDFDIDTPPVEYKPILFKTSLYSAEFANLDFFGVSIRSARDVVFFFCEIIMWWNFCLLITKFAFGLFSHDPLGAFVGGTNANAIDDDALESGLEQLGREKEMEDMQMEKSIDSKKYNQDRFDALQRQKDSYLDKKYLDYRMSHKKGD